jgi:hypothetical protein
MPRPSRTEIDQLVDEVRAMELLADEADVPPDRIEDYWALTTELIALVADVEEFQSGAIRRGAADTELLALRQRLRFIAAGLGELTLE